MGALARSACPLLLGPTHAVGGVTDDALGILSQSLESDARGRRRVETECLDGGEPLCGGESLSAEQIPSAQRHRGERRAGLDGPEPAERVDEGLPDVAIALALKRSGEKQGQSAAAPAADRFSGGDSRPRVGVVERLAERIGGGAVMNLSQSA